MNHSQKPKDILCDLMYNFTHRYSFSCNSIILLTFVLCLSLLSSRLAASELVRFAPLPMASPEAILKDFYPMLRYLEAQLGITIEVDYYASHDELTKALEEGRVNMTFLGPLPYIALKKRTEAITPVVLFQEASGKSRYRCALVAFQGDNVKLHDLNDASIALTQPLSTCGYLGTHTILQEQANIYLKDLEYQYLGSHDAVALAVIGGKFLAGGVKDSYAYKYAPLGLEVISYSDWIPGIGLFVNHETLEPIFVQRLKQTLLDTPEAIYQTWGELIRYGMSAVRDEDFIGITMMDNLPVIMPVQGH